MRGGGVGRRRAHRFGRFDLRATLGRRAYASRREPLPRTAPVRREPAGGRLGGVRLPEPGGDAGADHRQRPPRLGDRAVPPDLRQLHAALRVSHVARQGHDRGHHLRVAVGRRHDAAGRAPLPRGLGGADRGAADGTDVPGHGLPRAAPPGRRGGERPAGLEPAGVAAAAARLRVRRVARAADADHDRARPHRPAQPLPQRRPRGDRSHQRHGGGRAGADGAADRPAAADRGRPHAGLPAAGRDPPRAVRRGAVPALAGRGAARVVAGLDPRHRGGGRPRPAGDLAGRAAGERDPPHRRRATASASTPSSWRIRCC